MDVPTNEVLLEVEFTNAVDPILEKYKGIPGDSAISRYCEPAYVIGEEVPAFIFGEDIPALTIDENIKALYTGATFDQCGIEDGGTLHLLLSNRRYIVIQNEFINGEKIHYFMPLLTTVANMKEIVRRDYEDSVDHPPAEELALMIGSTLLDDSKTLADYNTEECSGIRLCTKQSIIPVGVPKYTRMEQVLFKPKDTIANLKDAVKKMMPDFQFTEGMRKAYRVPLRGSVQNSAQSTSYLYMDLFREKMKIFIYEHNTRRIHGCYLDNRCTLNDIRRIIRKEDCDREYIPNPQRKRNIPRYYLFDHVWTRTFAPQIEAEPFSWKMPMTLFFFPLRTDRVQLCVRPLRISEIIHVFCEEERHMKGIDRLMYHPQTKVTLSGGKPLTAYGNVLVADGEPYSLIITKRFKKEKSVKVLGTRITLQVRWQTRGEIRAVSFRIGLLDTINRLQDRIEDEIKVPLFLQKLLLDGQPVQGNSTLQEVGIENGSTIDLHSLPDDE